MRLTRASIRNPHLVWAIALALCILGVALVPGLPADILPDFKKPVVVSFFSYPGLPTGEMEKSVTSRVERALTLAGRIEHQESRTLPGASMIKVFFQPGTDPSSAMNDIVNLEASDMFHLPPGIEWPFTMRSEPANLPVVLGAISGEGLSESELYQIGYYAVRNKMGGLPGVQIPHPFGGKFRQMMVYADPQRLHGHHLGLTDVVDALKRSNLVLGGGTAKIGSTEYQVHPVNTLPTPGDIDDVPIVVRAGRPVFIRDIGHTEDAAALQYNIVRVDGERSVYVPLLREPGENTIAVVDRIRDAVSTEIPAMKARGELPESASVELVSDQSQYLRTAIRNLEYEVGLGALLVTLVVLLFLRRLRPSLAVVLLIPLSLLVGMLGFAFTGNTINVMTLGGLALAVGTVVDAGIVVVENIVRHLEAGRAPREAAAEATAEVAAPVLAGTVTTLAVFIPAIFLSGMVKYLFAPLAAAAVITIAVSYVGAITLIPSVCAWLLGRRASASGERAVDERTGGLFARLLTMALRYRRTTVITAITVVTAIYGLAPRIGTELFPDVDAGTFELRVRTEPGTRLEETEALVASIEDTIREVIPDDEVQNIISNIGVPVGKSAGFSTVLSSNSGPDSAFLVVNLHAEGRRTSTRSYVETLRRVLADRFPTDQFLFVTGGLVNAALNEGVAAPIDIQLSAGSLAKCRAAAELVVDAVRRIPGAVDVQLAQAQDYPQLDIEVDRTKAALMGLDQDAVAKNILTALSSSVGYASNIWVDPKTGVDFFLGVQLEDNELGSLDELRALPLPVTTEAGAKTIPLSSVARIEQVKIPGEIAHHNIARINDVYVNVSGRDLGSVAADVERALARLELGAGVTATVRGPVSTMRAGMENLGWGMLVALGLVYLVMMAQFRSLIDPLIILIAAPLGVAGVVLILFVTGTTLNIQSLMGALMMLGVVVNNSILLVEFAGRRVREGATAVDAARDAARVRLRPILMTALATIFALTPMALGITGHGGFISQPLAI
ncbi:MAG: efflux RND transporter permease subunit, partial [Myxococcales bacterium]|nr:efflux RND transporter permease subunit [Myxococcales bacterium]